MIPFSRLDLHDKDLYNRYLHNCGERGCEYSFTNLFLWGRQKAAFVDGFLTLFSQFNRRSVYPFPIGEGDPKPVLDAIIHDARTRGIPCCLSSMTQADCDTLERLYPGAFRFYADRDTFDYVYSVEDLAELKGRKFQKKRNHLNRFRQNHPDCQALPLDETTRVAAFWLLRQWYETRLASDPLSDFHLEQIALERAFAFQAQLGIEGLVLMEHGQPLAFAIGSRLNDETFDIHFEKAREDVDGAYAAINQAFAQHLQEKYPELKWLNREDDLGIEGLRKAKLSYNPHHLVEKYWARLWEEEYDHYESLT